MSSSGTISKGNDEAASKGNIDAGSSFEKALDRWKPGKILMRLFIAGNSIRSQMTVDTLCQLCEKHLENNYQLEIVDIYQQPELARQQQIIATPTLVKYQPEPRKLIIGDFSQAEKVLACLGVAAY